MGVARSADTILRHLKRRAAANRARHPVRVVGIDDWAARKGHNYGTIIVDLERREVVDVLQVRSARSAARWFRDHPEIQVVTRDRCGLYARAAYEGAPQARQCADRFHLVQNLREAIEQQLYRRSAGETEDSLEDDGTERTRATRRSIREAKFEQVRQLSEQRLSTIAICRATRLHVRTVKAWRQLKQLPERYRMEPKLCTPAYFHEPLREAWDCGVTRGRALFALIQGLGYTGSRSHLARYLAPWRSFGRRPRASDDPRPSSMTRERPEAKIPPVAGAALCMAFEQHYLGGSRTRLIGSRPRRRSLLRCENSR
jgi:Transposase